MTFYKYLKASLMSEVSLIGEGKNCATHYNNGKGKKYLYPLIPGPKKEQAKMQEMRGI